MVNDYIKEGEITDKYIDKENIIVDPLTKDVVVPKLLNEHVPHTSILSYFDSLR